MSKTSVIRSIGLILFFLVSSILPTHAAIIYVNTTGRDSNDGSSWESAKRTVQAGLNTAVSGDDVWVAVGTYVERITLNDGVGLYGGFAGNETNRSERNWTANVTILDGNQGGSVVTCPAGATASTAIDGFTIRNGNGTLVSGYRRGGGIYCHDSSPAISNNTISGANADYGGGVFCYGGSPNLSNNTISGNSAVYGSGIYCYLSSPVISNNTMSGNSASSSGGAILSYDSSPLISNNTICENSGRPYGGAISCYGGSAVIANNTISGNSGTVGGGIYCANSSPSILNNTISGNSGASGGGIYCSYSSPCISNNTISGNSASEKGGGIYCYHSYPPISNNTISGNTAAVGGGICCYGGYSQISNNIVAFNSSGVFLSGGTLSLKNNDVYGNWAYNYSGLDDPSGTYGNISADPKFVGFAYGDLHIQPDSPCRDAGDDSVVQPGWLDMDGQARIQGDHVDIGADESDGTAWPSAEPNIVVRVRPDGNDSNDGSSWALAKRTVQAGIDLAAPVGGEVWVAAGTYNQRIALKRHAHVYGGFAGAETNRSQRDQAANVTVLDGQQGGSVVIASEVIPATIDGFTIRNGKATKGGGISCSRSIVTISNNTVSGNSAPQGTGGGIYCYGDSSIISGNTISGNSVNSGQGGGVYCSDSSSTTSNNTISGNSASYGAGGGIYYVNSSASISNNTIKGNSASWGSGGGIYCFNSSPSISNNTISGNNCIPYGYGGGIRCHNSSPSISNNTVSGNSASDGGGGIYCSSSSPSMSNNIVAFNNSGIGVYSSNLAFKNNDVYGNLAYNYSGVTDPTGTNGNISVDPNFAGFAYGDLHIQPDSPCRDAGDDGSVQPEWLDIDGQARIQGDHVDIGSDESDGTAWPSTGPNVVVKVKPDGDDSNDGSSWALAKRTVQAGIELATAVGGEVWVTAGTYNERVILRRHAHVYGGFAGTETDKSQRDWSANMTVLDGQEGGSVVTASDVISATIDGFMIRNGKANSGGGISSSCSFLTISNNTISGSRADGVGGGISCSLSFVSISNNTISGNSSAYAGGGISCSSCSSSLILGNVLSGNSTGGYGGGIYYAGSMGSVSVISNNTMSGNSANWGGGIRCSGLGSADIMSNNTISGNTAGDGGGIYCTAYLSMSNNIVAFNNSGVYQSGVYQSDGDLTVTNNNVYGNAIYNYSGTVDPTGTRGNISLDPKFADLANGNLHIQPDSPCVDAGDDSVVQPGWLDMDGQARIQGDHVDIGADESDGSQYCISYVITAAFPDFFYVEKTNRTSGIRVDMANHGLQVGMRANVVGPIKTNLDRERYIEAGMAEHDGFGTVSPLAMNNRSLGGADRNYNPGPPPSGQQGVKDGVGLNNIGLLVTLFGRVTEVDASDTPTWFRIDDGSGVGVKVVLPMGVAAPDVDTYVRVTGASSCEKLGDDILPLLRMRSVDGEPDCEVLAAR